MKNKQIIKLTESDLKQLVTESVNKILTELDWKTYQNAAHKDYNPKRGKEFSKMAAYKFNKNFGYNTDSTTDNDSVQLRNGYGKANDNYLSIHSKNGYKGQPTKFASKSSKEYINNDPNDKYYYTSTKDTSTQELKPFTQDKRHARKIQNAYNEFENYRQGNYTYNKGQGWTKNKNNIGSNDFHDFLKYQ